MILLIQQKLELTSDDNGGTSRNTKLRDFFKGGPELDMSSSDGTDKRSNLRMEPQDLRRPEFLSNQHSHEGLCRCEGVECSANPGNGEEETANPSRKLPKT
ncbi:unnamed protein product [Microthlaspi erraticum]|uniref:Uncharacterized protein n=1 Tax=Microthlaspi erraticum TaxID=1685480 RepID=A0A6D2IFE3_9BRAS|nr:unnamed protein product [Microthlaspi erraticum]